MSKMKNIFNAVDTISEKIGRAASFVIFIIMTITTVEVVARYVFNYPTIWVWPINRQLFGVFILFAGIYTMSKGGHIRIEILYDHLSSRMKLIARLIALASFIVFMGVLIWQGSWMGWSSLSVGETASGAFRIPLYPLKLLIPIAALLFLLEGIVVLCRRKN
jgi:TRAP-type mannitol/chloroaromatic compound transport system permease small subunit